MIRERASIFEAEDDLDVSAFAPRKARSPALQVDKEAIERVASAKGFKSREASLTPNVAPPVVEPVVIPSRTPRRFVTGRNRQLNLKVTDEAVSRFYAIADANSWVLGETFEIALEALERQLSTASDATRSKGRVQKVSNA
jgi:hypothetical protein